MSLSITLHLLFWQCLSLNLEFIDLVRLVSQWASGILPTTGHTGTLSAFYVGAMDLNSSPHPCMASILLTGPSLSPSSLIFNIRDYNYWQVQILQCAVEVLMVDIFVSFLISGGKHSVFYHYAWYISCRGWKKPLIRFPLIPSLLGVFFF